VTPERGARPLKGEPAKRDDRSAALADLASVGATPDDDRVRALGAIFRTSAEYDAADALADNALDAMEPWRDFQAIKRALDRVKLVSEAGEALRANLFRVVPLRYLGAAPLRGREVYVARLSGLTVKAGRVVPPIAESCKKGKRGRPVAADVEMAVLTAEVMWKWNWKACAAAVFITCPSAYRYAAIKKSFRDWDRRHRRPAR
jgi:hypothetical protein